VKNTDLVEFKMDRYSSNCQKGNGLQIRHRKNDLLAAENSIDESPKSQTDQLERTYARPQTHRVPSYSRRYVQFSFLVCSSKCITDGQYWNPMTTIHAWANSISHPSEPDRTEATEIL
jgi:hypothetical protein